MKAPAGAPMWMTTFADMMSLLMCFFVLLLSFSEMDVEKFKQIAGSMKVAFGVQRIVQAQEAERKTIAGTYFGIPIQGRKVAFVFDMSASMRYKLPLALDQLTRAVKSLPSHAMFDEELVLTRPIIDWFVAHYLNDAADRSDPRFAPLRRESLAGLPPAVIVTAEYDPLRDEGAAYAERLQATRVTSLPWRFTSPRPRGIVYSSSGTSPLRL